MVIFYSYLSLPEGILKTSKSPRSPRSPERRGSGSAGGSHAATARLHVRDAVQDAAAAAVPRRSGGFVIPLFNLGFNIDRY